MPFYAIYQIKDGTLVSLASVVDDDKILQQKGLAKKEIDKPSSDEVWNPQTLDFEARVIETPPKTSDELLLESIVAKDPKTLTDEEFRQAVILSIRKTL